MRYFSPSTRTQGLGSSYYEMILGMIRPNPAYQNLGGLQLRKSASLLWPRYPRRVDLIAITLDRSFMNRQVAVDYVSRPRFYSAASGHILQDGCLYI